MLAIRSSLADDARYDAITHTLSPLTVLESAQATLGEAAELVIAGHPYRAQKYPDEARRLPDQILRLQAIIDNITSREARRSA